MKTSNKHRTGRPTAYTNEEAAKICAHIVSGKSVKSYCQRPDAPCVTTIYNWLAENKTFLAMYTRAREDQADTLADEILEIADDSTLDPNDRRVKIEARKWIASKLKPKTYGDKVQAEVSGQLTLERIVLRSYKTGQPSVAHEFDPITGVAKQPGAITKH